MADTYEIKYQGEPVGHVKTQKQGLYLLFTCRCRLPDDGMYRIHAIGSGREDLGICVPMDGSFGMDKKIPLKRLGEGELTFQLVSKDWKPQEPVLEPEMEPLVQVEEKTVGQVIEEEPIVAEETIAEQEPIVVEETIAEQESIVVEESVQPKVEEEIFIPVSEEEPFDYLDKLEQAHMDVRNDQPGIVFSENTDE